MTIFVSSLLDAVVDTLKTVPILFLAYLLVAFLSHDHNHKFSKILSKNSKSSVFYASVLGCVPQCGFSSVVADLYSQKTVSLGTLIAVFVATSDEALPLMISETENPQIIVDMLILIAIKIVLAIFWGYAIDLVVRLCSRRRGKAESVTSSLSHEHNHGGAEPSHVHEGEHEEAHEGEHLHEHEHEALAFKHHHECGHIHTADCDSHCGHSHGNCCGNNIFAEAFDHTFTIMIYIFVATFIINIIVGCCGTEALESLLTDSIYVQILVAGLIGLIPNCASSVLLVELFVYGSLGFPALIAGLTTGAGVGLIILFTRNKKEPLKNIGILLLQYSIGVVSGLVLSLFL